MSAQKLPWRIVIDEGKRYLLDGENRILGEFHRENEDALRHAVLVINGWDTLTAQNDQLRARIAELEEALSVRIAIEDTNRTLAEDWKQLNRDRQAAEQRGNHVEWWIANGTRFTLLIANIMDRLTWRETPQPPAQEEDK